MKYFLTLILALSASFLLNSQATAQVAPECSDLYNSPGSCEDSPQFSVRKQIQNPQTGEFVDTLTPDQARIQPGSNVVFRITITNTRTLAIEDINLTDILPDALTSVRPQKGEFNDDNNTLSYYRASLEPEASDTIEVQATVKSQGLPGRSPLCLANIVSVIANQDTVVDNIQFCIGGDAQVQGASAQSPTPPANTQQSTSQPQASKGGKPVTSPSNASTSPNTGPAFISLLALLPAALGGIYLRNKS
jgi:uncharacterized repeat protein (TIGR01451 family)